MSHNNDFNEPKFFRGNETKLKKGVFVFQYDTEQIVDFVLEKKIINGSALEIGSGTGVISIALSKETNLNVTSIDINPKAIELSKINDFNNKVNFLMADFNDFNSNTKYDLIISNPPYIAHDDQHIEEWVKKNQPSNALYADNNGLSFYELIFDRIDNFLISGGYIILEIGYNQAKSVQNIFSKISNSMEVKKDYSGHDRFVIIKYDK